LKRLKEVSLKLRFYDEEELKDSIEQKIKYYSDNFEKLSHHNVVKLLDCFQLSETSLIFIVEYCDGDDLYTYIVNPQNQLSEKEVRNFLKQILYGLSFLHEKKLIHGNLKPQNILFHEGELKISDYWFLKENILNEERIRFEERAYFPLECQISFMNQELDYSFDMWSIGVVCYRILFNEKPDLRELKLPQKPLVSNEAKEFVLKCLIMEKQKRWTAKQALAGVYLSKK